MTGQNNYKILLDMDGVLANFVAGICRYHRKVNPYLDAKNCGKFDMAAIWGMSIDEFWEGVNAEFWGSLSPTEECFQIVEQCVRFAGLDNIRLLTHPPDDAYAAGQCIQGKIEWVEHWLPELSGSFIFTGHKEWCADSKSILIDDNDNNTDNFFQAGGYTITVPRPWNRLQGINVMQHISQALDVYSELTKASRVTR